MPDDRRDPTKQEARLGGRRASDPTLSTRRMADALGVTPQFIAGEIKDGRLRARLHTVPGARAKRAMYRASREDFDAYLRAHWPYAPFTRRAQHEKDAEPDYPGRPSPSGN